MKRKMSVLLTTVLTAGMLASAMLPAAAEGRSLHINWLSSRAEDEAVLLAMKDIAAQYAEENPDLDFSFEIESISDRTAYLQKQKILAASDELPEWFDADPDSWFAEMVAAGQTAPIEDLYEELGLSDKIFDISKEYARLNDGTLHLMTFQCNTEYFFYHKDLFEQAGITEEPTTFDELLEDCQKLADAGITPISMAGGGGWPILRYSAMVPFRLADNEYIFNACDGTDSFGTEAGIKGAEFMRDIAQYFQIGWGTADYDTMIDLFASGQVAMMYNGTWALQQADMMEENGEMKETIGAFKMPIYSENDVTPADDCFANSGIGTAIRADALDDEMKAFVKYMLEHYAEAALSYDLLPSVMPEEETMNSLPGIYQQIIEDVSKVSSFTRCWDVVIDASLVEPLEKETVTLGLGEITPEEWAANMDAHVANK